MARITVEDCLKKIDNQYDLVLLAKERTVQLNAGSPMLVEEDNDKRTIISLREIGDGKIPVKELEDNAIKRLRKEPDEIEKQEEIEEEVNDDFENLYKGQISKSGVAILNFGARLNETLKATQNLKAKVITIEGERSKLALKTSKSNKQTGWTTKIIELRVLMSKVITYYLVVLLFSMYVGNMIVLSFAMPFFLAPLLTLFTYP